MEASCHQNRIKNHCQLRKTDLTNSVENQFNNLYFFEFRRSKLGANMNQKSIKKWGQQGKASWHRFLSPSRPIWAPSWPYLGTSGAILVPSWRHVRSPWANFGRILAHLGSILAHLGSPWRHLGAILAHLGPILAHLGPILAHLGSILASFWSSCPILAPS